MTLSSLSADLAVTDLPLSARRRPAGRCDAAGRRSAARERFPQLRLAQNEIFAFEGLGPLLSMTAASRELHLQVNTEFITLS